MSRLDVMLIRHERLQLKLYVDTMGKPTIGVGRDLADLGITTAEAIMLLENDIARVTHEATVTFPWFSSLDVVRQDAVCDMLFNLGLTRFLEFKLFIQAMVDKDYDAAANQMMASTWAGQVGKRAVELSAMIRTGQYADTIQ